jgi:TPR repeat protein
MRNHETQPGQEGSPDQTQKLVLPLTSEAPQRTQKISLPAGTAGQTQTPHPPAPSRSRGWKLSLVLGGLIVLGGVVFLVSSRGPALQAPAARAAAPESEAEVPGAARAYLDQAKAGDANAMRMLGAMYYYGLDVPPNREKGLSWYRKAAEAGSEVARTELSRLEAVGK